MHKRFSGQAAAEAAILCLSAFQGKRKDLQEVPPTGARWSVVSESGTVRA